MPLFTPSRIKGQPPIDKPGLGVYVGWTEKEDGMIAVMFAELALGFILVGAAGGILWRMR